MQAEEGPFLTHRVPQLMGVYGQKLDVGNMVKTTVLSGAQARHPLANEGHLLALPQHGRRAHGCPSAWEEGACLSHVAGGGPSSKATLWVKAQHEGALPPPCIVRKDPRVPHTARRGA